MVDLYLTPAERYTAALGGFYYGDLPEPGTVYTQLIKDILNGTTPDKEPKNILARFIYSLYISDLGDPYPRYELTKLLYWKLHDITPTKSGSILTVTIDGKEDYMTINTDLSRLWYKVLFGSKTDVITEFPYIFNTIQNKLSDWELFGNTVQSGTPTPDNPVMPQGTGERTWNLFDLNRSYSSSFTTDVSKWMNGAATTNNTGDGYAESVIADDSVMVTSKVAGYGASFLINVSPNTTYTISFETDKTSSDSFAGFSERDNEGNVLRNGAIQSNSATITTGQNCVFLNLCFRFPPADGTVKFSKIMLNEGSTALPYEPYGYKIPISMGGTTTPVYLGEVQTARRIKKLVLTGDENFVQSYAASNTFYFTVSGYLRQRINITKCSHYTSQANISGGAEMQNGHVSFYAHASQTGQYFYVRDSNFTTIDALKSYLQQQYAAGTPVTVWYVLANEETGIVNEPLMKIGEYADSLSRGQTGVDIPTVIGQNTLDVLTTVKPLSMSIEYTSAEENQSRSKRISLFKSPLKKGLIK